MKERSLWFVFKYKHVVEWTKMLIKLITVESNHFIKYKGKITNCLASQTLSEYISRTVLDNEKLRGSNWCWDCSQYKQVSRYTKPSTCYNEGVNKFYVRWFTTFYFLIGSSVQCLLSAGIRSHFTQRDICRKMEQMYLPIVKEYIPVDVTHNLPVALKKRSTQGFFCWVYSF